MLNIGFRLLPVCALILLETCGHTANFSASKNTAVSPDKSLTFHIERLNDYNDPFSGKMLLQLTDNNVTGSVHQRLVEGTRIRTMTPSRWLDDTWVGFAYNVGKNTTGYTYYNAKNHETLLIETDVVSQLMGSTGQIEKEMQNLFLTQYTNNKSATLQLQNLTWGEGICSIFPLYLPDLISLPQDNVPDLSFLYKVQTALKDYQALCKKQNVTAITPELGTESFDKESRRCAFLATMGTTPTLMLMPLYAKDSTDAMAQSLLIPLPSMVRLASLNVEDEPFVDDNEDMEDLTAIRFTTKWGERGTTIIGREIYDELTSSTQLQPVCEVDPTGKLTMLQAPEWPDEKSSAPTTDEN